MQLAKTTLLSSSLLVVAMLFLILSPTKADAAAWYESGDAGDSIATANMTAGTGNMHQIIGNITMVPDNVDMYCVSIPFLAGFSAHISCELTTERDLWLFDSNGYGVSLNDGCTANWTFISGTFGSGDGQYYLAISCTDDEALSSSGTIWDPASASGQRAPDGPGAADPLIGWSTFNLMAVDPYLITIEGGEFCDDAVAVETRTWDAAKAMYR
jgi:hypothetical protein